MKLTLLSILLALSIVIHAEELKVTVASNAKNQEEKIVVIEVSDQQLMDNLLLKFGEQNLNVFTRDNVNETDKSFIILSRNEFIDKSRTLQDCLMGVGFCLGGVAFVAGTGETGFDPNNPPTGFYASVGDRFVTGGSAVFTCLLWTTGIVFGIKGIIEIFTKKSKQSAAIYFQDSEDILSKIGFYKESQFAISCFEGRISPELIPIVVSNLN